MENLKRNFNDCKRIVVKVGTTTLTYQNGTMNFRAMREIAYVLSDLINQGKEIILVTSAAIAVGTEKLSLSERPRDIVGKQVAAAVGQAALMNMYEKFFIEFNQIIAQILLTKDVVDNATRKTNVQNTMWALIERGIIPVINENDAISTDELEFTDNDTLSSYVAIIAEADLLIVLSDIEGLYTGDPKENPDAEFISEVKEITPEVEAFCGGAGSELGTGGMLSKLSAAKNAVSHGIDMVIASGEKPSILFSILEGEIIGTRFIADAK